MDQHWWAGKGFAEAPREVIAKGGEILYRVGGGQTNLALGSFFTPLNVDRVSVAEQRMNIVTWGNRCLYVATYRVKAGTRMWVGRIAHGAADVADRTAEQVYIEQPWFAVQLVKDVEALKQDLFVAPRAGYA